MKWLACGCVLIISPLLGLYNGNPYGPNSPEHGFFSSDQSWWSIGCSYERTIFNKHIYTISSKPETSYCKGVINQGVFIYNIADRCELYGKIGDLQLDFDSQWEYSQHINVLHGMCLSVGGRFIVIDWGGVICLGVNGVYTTSRLSEYHSQEICKVNYQEWQGGAGLAANLNYVTPYIGLAYGSMHVPLKQYLIQNKRPWIMVVGCGFSLKKGGAVNIEGRFFGEKGSSLDIKICF